MQRVDPARLDLAREFKSNPTGPHTPEPQKLLKLLRWEPLSRRFIVVQPRRAEDGIRSWQAEGGEYYHSFANNVSRLTENVIRRCLDPTPF